jgi:hypothetical protein
VIYMCVCGIILYKYASVSDASICRTVYLEYPRKLLITLYIHVRSVDT